MTNINYTTVSHFSDNEVLERLNSRLNIVRSYNLSELLEIVLNNSDCSGHYGYGYFINLPGVGVPVGFQTEDNFLTIYIQDNQCDESYISVNIDSVGEFETDETGLELISELHEYLVG